MLEFDITTEDWREYMYPNGDTYTIRGPKTLYLKQDDNGDSHRIVDFQGVTHYVRRGWVAIKWFAPNEPVSF